MGAKLTSVSTPPFRIRPLPLARAWRYHGRRGPPAERRDLFGGELDLVGADVLLEPVDFFAERCALADLCGRIRLVALVALLSPEWPSPDAVLTEA